MKKIIAIAAAAIAISMFADLPTATAQNFQNSYRLGAGLRIGRGFAFPQRGFVRPGFGNRFEEPPYFAKYPPVYYSGPVARPYGISPYAVPPGIMPVEMTLPKKPVTIQNPYFKSNDPVPASDVEAIETGATEEEPKAEKSQNKITRILNPHYHRAFTRRD